MATLKKPRPLVFFGIFICLLSALLLINISRQTNNSNALSPHLHDGLVLRAVTKDDLDDVFEIVRTIFPDGPEVDPRFPYRKQYPKDYEKWTRMEYEHYLEQDKKFVFRVIEAPTGTVDKVTRKTIALAVWDVAVLTKANGTDEGLDERRDANKEHAQAFIEAARETFQEYFAKYRDKQIHLWLIVTHPDYRRRGAGSMLTKWRIDTPEEKDWPVTVFASPMGELLYASLGFQRIATKVVRFAGEDEKLVSGIMEKV